MRRSVLVSAVLMVAFAGVGLVGGLSSAGAVKARWVVTDLGSSSWPVAINDRGQVVGGDFFLWKGKMTKLGTLGGWRVTASAVNERGQVVGYSVTGKDAALPLKPHAFVWQSGKMVDITPSAHPDARAFAINGRCQIVGYEGTDKNGHPVKAAFVWQGGELSDLPSLSGATDSTAYAINGAGEIVGWSGNHAVLWKNGTLTDLGTLPGDRFSRAQAINGQGQIVGWSSKTWNGESHGVLWAAGKATDLGKGGAFEINELGQVIGDGYLWRNGRRTSLGAVRPAALNDRGQIVGQDYLHDSAVVWQNGHTTALPGLGGKDSWAVDVNNNGQIVGVAALKNGDYRAVLWMLRPGR